MHSSFVFIPVAKESTLKRWRQVILEDFFFFFFSAMSLCLPWFSSTWSIVRCVEIRTTREDSRLSREGQFQPVFFLKVPKLEIS